MQKLFYLPEFVNQAEELQLLAAVDAAPATRWINAGERKMQNWGGRPGESLVREVLHESTSTLACLHSLQFDSTEQVPITTSPYTM